ncbi:MAG: HPr family phosphocarrier protein [Sedimentisphaerales bacterium]|nr:HPr family phosphocarrier protein [Sedimentisphaerales bacterium]
MQQPLAQDSNTAEKIVEIRNRKGLHLRPAMEFIECANSFDSKITVSKGSVLVDAKSIMHVATLAAGEGTRLKIVAVGNDAREAVEKLAALIDAIPDSEE